MPPVPPRPKIPHRNQSPSGFAALLQGALGNRTDLLKQVCDFYSQDYLCFGYSRPLGCEPPPKAGKK